MSDKRPALAVIETHPIQYRAPVYRELTRRFGIPVTVIYGSDFSVAGYYDTEFRSQFAWDSDLLAGYDHRFLGKVEEGAGRTYETVSPRGMGRALRELNPGAILLPGYSPRFHQLAWWHALRSGRPILFRGETTDRPQEKRAFRLAIRHGLLGALYRRCARILYIGTKSRDHYASFGYAEQKLIFSPYCVDTEPFQMNEDARERLRGCTREALKVGITDRVLLFSGKLSERKGPDLLIAAVKAMPAELRSRTVIVFLGNGEMLPALKASARLEPGIEVRFAGFQNQKQISGYYHAADLLVLPSRRFETWGLVVNEALHHGLPCVVSDVVGSGPDLVNAGTTGEIFENGSVESLGAALVRAMAIEGREDTRENCRARVEPYSVTRAAQGIAEAYESVV